MTLAEGKPTFASCPYHMQCTMALLSKQAWFINEAIENNGMERLDDIMAVMKETGSLRVHNK